MEKININYLMEYISRRLHTIVRKFDREWKVCSIVCMRKDFTDWIDLLMDDFHNIADVKLPVILSDEDAISYGAAVVQNEIFVVGPVLVMKENPLEVLLRTRHVPTPSLPRIKEVSRFRISIPQKDASWMKKLHTCSAQDLCRDILLIYNLFREDTASLDETETFNYLRTEVVNDVKRDYTQLIFHNHENNIHHNPYDQELREKDAIRKGDIPALKRAWQEDFTGKLGCLAKDELRNNKNLMIVVITNASRAAIEGGLSSEIAFSLSDTYINKIENLSNPEEVYRLGREAECLYATLVKDLRDEKEHRKVSPDEEKDKKSPHAIVIQCKDYVFTHLHRKISTSDIAKALYLNPNYLSGLFKKEEGITITEYVHREKVKLAKDMLIYSRYSSSEIAEYLSYSSQSHLGAVFKKITGYTLNQYRKSYGMREFLDGGPDGSGFID